jgi:hypothetical protein
MVDSLPIPQDIIGDVIAAAGNDKHLLSAQTTVSFSFLLPSRKHS